MRVRLSVIGGSLGVGGLLLAQIFGPTLVGYVGFGALIVGIVLLAIFVDQPTSRPSIGHIPKGGGFQQQFHKRNGDWHRHARRRRNH